MKISQEEAIHVLKYLRNTIESSLQGSTGTVNNYINKFRSNNNKFPNDTYPGRLFSLIKSFKDLEELNIDLPSSYLMLLENSENFLGIGTSVYSYHEKFLNSILTIPNTYITASRNIQNSFINFHGHEDARLEDLISLNKITLCYTINVPKSIYNLYLLLRSIYITEKYLTQGYYRQFSIDTEAEYMSCGNTQTIKQKAQDVYKMYFFEFMCGLYIKQCMTNKENYMNIVKYINSYSDIFDKIFPFVYDLDNEHKTLASVLQIDKDQVSIVESVRLFKRFESLVMNIKEFIPLYTMYMSVIKDQIHAWDTCFYKRVTEILLGELKSRKLYNFIEYTLPDDKISDFNRFSFIFTEQEMIPIYNIMNSLLVDVISDKNRSKVVDNETSVSYSGNIVNPVNEEFRTITIGGNEIRQILVNGRWVPVTEEELLPEPEPEDDTITRDIREFLNTEIVNIEEMANAYVEAHPVLIGASLGTVVAHMMHENEQQHPLPVHPLPVIEEQIHEQEQAQEPDDLPEITDEELVDLVVQHENHEAARLAWEENARVEERLAETNARAERIIENVLDAHYGDTRVTYNHNPHYYEVVADGTARVAAENGREENHEGHFEENPATEGHFEENHEGHFEEREGVMQFVRGR